jgi:hypothetical protein
MMKRKKASTVGDVNARFGPKAWICKNNAVVGRSDSTKVLAAQVDFEIFRIDLVAWPTNLNHNAS